MTFSLTITLDSTAVSNINGAGQTVTLAQSVTSIAQTGDARRSPQPSTIQTPLAWLTFSPLESNTVSWSGQLQLYATTTPLDPGAVVAINSQTSATGGIQLGSVYTFANGAFTAATGSGDAYVAANRSGSTFGFGLLAAATVNGSSATGPLDALTMLNDQNGFFYTPTAVFVFLSSASQNGTVLPTMPSGALQLDLSSGSLDAQVCFNDTTNQFFVCT